MLIPSTTTQFRRDLKRQAKRGCEMEKLETVLDKLVLERPLDEKHHNHKLTGNYVDRWECHIEADLASYLSHNQDNTLSGKNRFTL